MTFSIISKVQSNLSTYQAVPIVGPIVVSPIKASMSSLQISGGLAAGLGFAATTLISDNNKLKDYTIDSFAECGNGVISLAYSIVNIASLGIVGYAVENEKRMRRIN